MELDGCADSTTTHPTRLMTISDNQIILVNLLHSGSRKERARKYSILKHLDSLSVQHLPWLLWIPNGIYPLGNCANSAWLWAVEQMMTQYIPVYIMYRVTYILCIDAFLELMLIRWPTPWSVGILFGLFNVLVFLLGKLETWQRLCGFWYDDIMPSKGRIFKS